MIQTQTFESEVLTQAKAAKQVTRKLASNDTKAKNEALKRMTESLWKERQTIFEANERDVQQARKQGTAEARIDRLIVTEQRLQEMIVGLEQLIALPDPVGEVLAQIERPNGMVIEKTRVPFGVIAMIYESRPNVTVDAAGLAVKTGNAVVLRGGKEALQSNQALVAAVKKGLAKSQVPAESIQLIKRVERETVDTLIQAKGIIDLAIPRGGAGLIERVTRRAQIPVIETGVGNCHVYVHQAANPKMAEEIVINAKTQRPSVCNAMETLLVDQAFAQDHLVGLLKALTEQNVELRGCAQTRLLARELTIVPATEDDYAVEHLDSILTVKVVDGIEAAIEHIEQYGTKHSEAIVTEDQEAAQQFLNQVDAAAVYHNVSTRFTDGFEYGFGAEIGISTQKLHARGPMGLPELTSYKYIVRGNGQSRS